ncbi:MAG: glycosyltransferase family 39 protein, partial [Flavitalea sp.]
GYMLIRYIQTSKTFYLYFFGGSIGLGMLCKYTVAFYTISLLAGLLLTPQRKIFLQKHFYGAALLALVIFLPNLIWQYTHNFPVITHMNELKETQLQYMDGGTFVKEQFMMFLPVAFVWIAGLINLVLVRSNINFRFYAWAYVVVVALMIWFKGKGYYILGVYPILFAFGATWLESLTEIRFRWTRIAMTVVAIGLGVVALPLLLPVAPPEKLTKYYEAIGSYKAGDFKWEDLKSHPLPQDFADMMGWREVTQKVAGVYAALPDAEKLKTIVIASNYAFAGALNHYGPALGLPETYSANASFLLWMPDEYKFDNMIYVDDRMPSEIELFKEFRTTAVKDSVDLPMFRENGTKVFLFEGANDHIRMGITELIKSRKKKFQR